MTQLATKVEHIREDLANEEDRAGQIAATRRLAEISEEWGLPILPELTSQDVTSDVLQAAINEQVEYVEARIPKIALGGNIKKWKSRNKMVLPLFFHTPVGRETIKRLVFASRFPVHEIALMCGLREQQLEAFIKGHNWSRPLIALQRQKDQGEWRSLIKHQITDGKMKVAKAVLKASNSISNREGDEILKDLPKLRMLNEIMDEVMPPQVDELGNKVGVPDGDNYSVNVGVEIISHQRRKFDPVEAAKKAQASEITQPTEE